MKVKLIRRWGPNPAGRTVDVDDVQGRWLVGHAFGTASGEQAPSQDAAAPGADGPDPLAGGDATRRTMRPVKGERRDNNALPVDGAPSQYRAGYTGEAPRVVSEGGEDPARGEVSAQHEQVTSDRPSQTGRRRKAATPERATASDK